MLLPIQTTWINNNYNKQARVIKQSYRMELQDKFTKEPMLYSTLSIHEIHEKKCQKAFRYHVYGILFSRKIIVS